MHKTHLESFVFEILFMGDYSPTFYLSAGTAWASEQDHLENGIHFCQGN